MNFYQTNFNQSLFLPSPLVQCGFFHRTSKDEMEKLLAEKQQSEQQKNYQQVPIDDDTTAKTQDIDKA